MGMIKRTLDKLLFAALLVVAMQVPILADHYLQYLTGFSDATSEEVSRYQRLANEFGYSSVESMVSELSNSETPVVRADAQNKAASLARLNELKTGINTLSNGHYFEQAWYMFHPTRTDTLERVVSNFSPSVPLSAPAIAYSLITALALNLLLWTPIALLTAIRRWINRNNRHLFHPS